MYILCEVKSLTTYNWHPQKINLVKFRRHLKPPERKCRHSIKAQWKLWRAVMRWHWETVMGETCETLDLQFWHQPRGNKHGLFITHWIEGGISGCLSNTRLFHCVATVHPPGRGHDKIWACNLCRAARNTSRNTGNTGVLTLTCRQDGGSFNVVLLTTCER